jgi:gluconokinase
VIVIVMGVSGAGKTAIGEALAQRLGWKFIDADDHHPAENVAKMKAGIPLQDEDRWPWLDVLNQKIREAQDSTVLACSALKEKYRERLTRGLEKFEIVHLHGSFELIHQRLAQRKHRYMPASLLESQFAALEPPARAIACDVSQDIETCVAAIAARLER